MAFYKKRNAGGAKKARPARAMRKSAASAAKPTKKFTKMVQKIIHKDAETKQNSYTLATTAFNSGITTSGDVLRIIPVVDQGVTESQRIGDTIQGQKIDVRGHFFINVAPTASTLLNLPTAIPANARLMIRAFICSVKKYSNYDDAVANVASWSGQFLKNGNASQTLDGSIQSMYLPVNTDVITVHKEIKRYVTCPVLTSTSSGAPVNWIIGQSYDARGSVKFFNANLKCKKVLKYDESNFSPQNYAPFMVISYAHLDGSAPDVLETRISASYVSILFYEDM